MGTQAGVPACPGGAAAGATCSCSAGWDSPQEGRGDQPRAALPLKTKTSFHRDLRSANSPGQRQYDPREHKHTRTLPAVQPFTFRGLNVSNLRSRSQSEEEALEKRATRPPFATATLATTPALAPPPRLTPAAPMPQVTAGEPPGPAGGLAQPLGFRPLAPPLRTPGPQGPWETPCLSPGPTCAADASWPCDRYLRRSRLPLLGAALAPPGPRPGALAPQRRSALRLLPPRRSPPSSCREDAGRQRGPVRPHTAAAWGRPQTAGARTDTQPSPTGRGGHTARTRLRGPLRSAALRTGARFRDSRREVNWRGHISTKGAMTHDAGCAHSGV